MVSHSKSLAGPNRYTIGRLSIALTLAIATLLQMASVTARAEEPSQMFLEALREEGYYDMALAYLDNMESSPLASAEFKQRLPFERAATLIASTATLRDINVWEERLSEAEGLLNKYAKVGGTDSNNARTQEYIGDLHQRRSLIYMKQSEADKLTAAEKDELLKKARGNFGKARTAYQQSADLFRNAVKNFQIDPQDPNSKTERGSLYDSFRRVRPRSATVAEQMADTFKPGDAQRKKLLQEAIKDLETITSANYPASTKVLAYYHAGSCYDKLNQPKKALTALEDIFILNNSSSIKPLKLRALLLGIKSWNKIEPYPYDSVIEHCGDIVGVLTRTDQRNADWMKVQIELAKAKYAKSLVIKEEKRKGATNEAKALKRDASKLIRAVAKIPGPTRNVARDLMTKWGVGAAGADEEEVATNEIPKTFADAKTKGQDYLAEVQSLYSDVSILRSEVSSLAKDANKANELNEKNDELKVKAEELVGQANKALQMFDLALNLTDEETVRADINNVRYQQSFCYFAMDQFFESALIGEFLMAKYPGVDWTKQAASLVVRSYAKLYGEAKPEDKAFEKSRLTSACDFTIKRWPGSAESSLAAGRMINMMLFSPEKSADDLAKMETYFSKIGDDDPSKPWLAAQIGQRIWFQRAAKKKAGTAAEELKTSLSNAQTYFEFASNNADAESLNYTTALSSLLLVEAFLESGQIPKAVKQLESHAIAPLDLLKQKHPAIQPRLSSFSRETYKTAIKVYLAAMQNGDQEKWIDRASGVLADMRNSIANDPKARSRVMTIYRMIGDELTNQFESLETPEEKRKLSKSLATFLENIEKESKDSKTVLWAGTTLLSVADALQSSGLDADAKPLFSQAVSSLSKAEKLGFSAEDIKKRYPLELKRQRALAQRGNGQYEAAIQQLADILKENSSNLSVQLDAATTLQMWGKSVKRPQAYVEAMMGGQKAKLPNSKREENLVWGWLKLVKALRKKEEPQLVEAFNRSLYGLIEARYEYGKIEKSSKAIESAKKELANAQKRDPDFGGGAWKARFLELEKRMKANQ